MQNKNIEVIYLYIFFPIFLLTLNLINLFLDTFFIIKLTHGILIALIPINLLMTGDMLINDESKHNFSDFVYKGLKIKHFVITSYAILILIFIINNNYLFILFNNILFLIFNGLILIYLCFKFINIINKDKTV